MGILLKHVPFLFFFKKNFGPREDICNCRWRKFSELWHCKFIKPRYITTMHLVFLA